MHSEVVIKADGLGKKFLIGHRSEEKSPTLRDALVRGIGAFSRTTAQLLRGGAIIAGDELEEFWALRNVSFEIKKGEVVGIVGRNGAGKSTLLKVLSRITEPTEGQVRIKGRVASLLEVGTGFHPELSGRENIFLNGAILGMARAEIKRKFDEIVAFAGVEKFLDTPVKRYSSGMYVRLAFAVAAHLEPEILIVDEVLAVGDAEFQKKCLGKMQNVAGEGRTVLFVSHNMAAIRALCPRSLLLESGSLTADGPTVEVTPLYSAPQNVIAESLGEHARLKRIIVEQIDTRDELVFELVLNIHTAQTVRDLAITVYSDTGARLCVVDLRGPLGLPLEAAPGLLTIRGCAAPVRLVEKDYSVNLFFGSNHIVADFHSLTMFTAPPPLSAAQRYPSEYLGFIDPRSVTAQIQYD